MSEFCAECGSQAQESDRFCRQCGQALSEAISSPKNILGTKNRRLMAVAAGVAFVGAAGATTGVLLTRSGPATKADTTALSPSATSTSTVPRQPTLSGTWEGSYRYRGGSGTDFTFAALFDGPRLSGVIMEPHSLRENASPPATTATVEGSVGTSVIRFSKRYSSGRVVEYEGTLDRGARRITGNWRMAGGATGTFSMSHRLAEQRIVSAAPQPSPPPQVNSNAQLEATIRSHLLNQRRIVHRRDTTGCDANGYPPPGRLACGSISMDTVPCSAIMAVERVEVADIGRDPSFGAIPVEAVVWIRVTDMEGFRTQQRAHVLKCVDAPGANWSTTRSVPVRFRFAAERWQSGWRIAGR